MEMNLRRFALLSLGAFTLMALARPPRPTGDYYEYYQDRSSLSATKRAMRITDDSISMLGTAIRVRVLRDSAVRVLSRLPAGAQNQLLADPRIPASLQQHLRQSYARTRASMPATAMALPMLVVLDSASATTSQVYANWIEPAQVGAPACATIIHLSVDGRDFKQLARRVNRGLRPNFPQAADFGLCGFEGAFGEPSPAMHRWMADRGWAAMRIGYDPALVAAKRAEAFNGVAYRYGRVPFFWFRQGDNGVRALGFHACRAGLTGFCVATAAPPTDVPRTGRPDGVPGNVLVRFGSYWWDWSGSPTLLNAVAASLGPQRFAELWRANDSLPDAYRTLTGVPMDTLAYRVVTASYPPLRAGASVTFGELVSVLLIAAALAGLSTLTHPRRRKP